MLRPRNPAQVAVETLAGPFCRCRPLQLLAPGASGRPEAKAAETGREEKAAGKPPPAPPDAASVVRDMERAGFVRLDARRAEPRGARDAVVILVLSAEGKYSHKSPELRRLIVAVQAEPQAREGRLDEIILVASDDFFLQKYLTDLVGEFRGAAEKSRRDAKAAAGDPGGVAAFIGAYPFSVFALPVLEHSAVPRHRLMSAAEAAAMLAEEMLDHSSLPMVRADDPPIVWLGARTGQTVEITRDSGTTLQTVYYRRVVDP